MKYLSIGIWVSFIFANAFIDGTRHLSGSGILFGNHIAAWIVRYMVAFLLILYVHYRGRVPYSWSTLGLFLIYGGVAWLEFDLVWNLTVGVPWTHVGTTAIPDKIFHFTGMAIVFQLLAKAVMTGFGVYLYQKFKDDES